jgi:hypothetical protein
MCKLIAVMEEYHDNTSYSIKFLLLSPHKWLCYVIFNAYNISMILLLQFMPTIV